MAYKVTEDRMKTLPEDLYKTAPPPFGHEMHNFFGFSPDYTNLNHGSYGSMPLPVRRYADELTTEIESSPDTFVRWNCKSRLDAVRARIAALVGAEVDEVVMVPNTSSGLSTIFHNIGWERGDVIVGATTTYGAVTRALQYISDEHVNHPTISTFFMRFPDTHSNILSNFKKHLKSINVPEGKKVVAVIDSIASNPGVVLPWKEMVQICKAEGVWTIIDAAHSIGQEVGINLNKAQPDFWVSNCHKWLFAKRGCAAMYVPKRNQHIIKSSFPTSHEYRPSTGGKEPPAHFVLQFDWNGTIDFVPYLSVAAALDFRAWLGGEEKINEYCHKLAIAGGLRLAEILGTYPIDQSPDHELTASMVDVLLPLPSDLEFSVEIDLALKRKLLLERNVYAAHYYHDGKWWTRCSTQIWNEISDFEVLGHAFLTVCKEIVQEFGGDNAIKANL